MNNQLNKKSGLTSEDLNKIKNGDTKAFQKLFNQYIGLVQFIATRFGIKGAEADDIIQEVFFRVYQEKDKLEKVESIKSWIATVTKNLIIDQKRKEQTITNKAEVLKDHDEHLIQQDLKAQTEREMELLLVQDIVKEITRSTKDPSFEQFYSQGLTIKEIAALQNAPVSTITSKISRLRTKFKEQIKQKIVTLRNNSL